MPDEPTLGEVVRRLEDVRQDLKEDLREYGSRLDRKVSIERYELERRAADTVHQQIQDRLKGIEEARLAEQRQAEQDRRAADDRRRQDRRLILTALIVPVLLVFLQAYLNTRGAGT